MWMYECFEGTRGVITFIFNGKKFSIYNHFVSYPKRLGVSLVKKLKIMLANFSIDVIIKKLKQ